MNPHTVPMSEASVQLRSPLWKGWPQAVVNEPQAMNPRAFSNSVALLELKFWVRTCLAVCRYSGTLSKGHAWPWVLGCSRSLWQVRRVTASC